jgi:uncharacterized protein (UPF0147 family)
MSSALIEKLYRSFDELENCIRVTKQVLSTKENVPANVLERVTQYSEIVRKQRSLARDLQEALERKDTDAVLRDVKVINGLSAMIRDDAEAILSSATDELTLDLSERERQFLS